MTVSIDTVSTKDRRHSCFEWKPRRLSVLCVPSVPRRNSLNGIAIFPSNDIVPTLTPDDSIHPPTWELLSSNVTGSCVDLDKSRLSLQTSGEPHENTASRASTNAEVASISATAPHYLLCRKSEDDERSETSSTEEIAEGKHDPPIRFQSSNCKRLSDVPCPTDNVPFLLLLEYCKRCEKVFGKVWCINPDYMVEILGIKCFQAFAFCALRNYIVFEDIPLNVSNEHDNKKMTWSWQQFSSFFNGLQQEYNCIPYHSCAHGLLVAHHFLCLLRMTNLWSSLSPEVKFATIVAGLGHDVGHFGRDTNFLKSANHLLVAYFGSNTAPLEEYHCVLIVRIFVKNGISLPTGLTSQVFMKWLRRLILATSSNAVTATELCSRRAAADFNVLANEDDAITACSILLRAADVGYASMEWEIVQVWVNRIYMEFRNQGDEIQSRGIELRSWTYSHEDPDFWNNLNLFYCFMVLPAFREACKLEMSLRNIAELNKTKLSAICMLGISTNMTKTTSISPPKKE